MKNKIENIIEGVGAIIAGIVGVHILSFALVGVMIWGLAGIAFIQWAWFHGAFILVGIIVLIFFIDSKITDRKWKEKLKVIHRAK